MRSIRIPDRIWLPFKDAAGADHTDIHRALIAWWTRVPGAQLPARPGGVIYTFRPSGSTQWEGQPSALPEGEYKAGKLTPTTGNYAGQELEIRYGPVEDGTLPAMRGYTTVGRDRVYPSKLVHKLLFEVGE